MPKYDTIHSNLIRVPTEWVFKGIQISSPVFFSEFKTVLFPCYYLQTADIKRSTLSSGCMCRMYCIIVHTPSNSLILATFI